MEYGFLEDTSNFATRAIHVGQDPEQWNSRAVVPPITMSNTFKLVSQTGKKEYKYGRTANPNRDILEESIASLDEGKYALCFASGLGATKAVINLLKTGDHIICAEENYSGSMRLIEEVRKFGIDITYVDTTIAKNVENAIQKNTKLLFLESPTNPLLKVSDLKAIAKITKKNNIIFAIDNTFLTSFFQKPLNLGVDIVIYSLTKYMNGHSDVIMGAIVTNDIQLRDQLYFFQKILGIVPSPFDCALVSRSLKTLALRMKTHMHNGMEVAKFLQSHAAVEKVMHPGLPSHPQHEVALRQSYGHSGMVAFYIKGGNDESKQFFSSLKLITMAGSLGSYNSLIEQPFTLSHASLPESQRVALGITENLIRLSVGLENVKDIINDLDIALNSIIKNK